MLQQDIERTGLLSPLIVWNHEGKKILVEKPADTVMYFTLFNELNVYESRNYPCALAPSFPDGKKDFIAFCDGSVRTFLKKDFPADPMEFYQKHVFLPGGFQ